jgi:hypothetical protein
MAEAPHPALVCKNWRRLIPLALRSLFILVDFQCSFQPTTSAGFFVILCLLHGLAKLFLVQEDDFKPTRLTTRCGPNPGLVLGTSRARRFGIQFGRAVLPHRPLQFKFCAVFQLQMHVQKTLDTFPKWAYSPSS